MGKYDEVIYRILSGPVTPNEAVKRLGVTYKTTRGVLMRLANIKGAMKFKNSGQIHIFCKKDLARNPEVSSTQNNWRVLTQPMVSQAVR